MKGNNDDSGSGSGSGSINNDDSSSGGAMAVWKVVSDEIRMSKLRFQSFINYINNFRRFL